jgi:hypothetical protein
MNITTNNNGKQLLPTPNHPDFSADVHFPLARQTDVLLEVRARMTAPHGLGQALFDLRG